MRSTHLDSRGGLVSRATAMWLPFRRSPHRLDGALDAVCSCLLQIGKGMR